MIEITIDFTKLKDYFRNTSEETSRGTDRL
jgi:hypothetical protein